MVVRVEKKPPWFSSSFALYCLSGSRGCEGGEHLQLHVRGDKNNRFFGASRFSLKRFRLDADKLIIFLN